MNVRHIGPGLVSLLILHPAGAQSLRFLELFALSTNREAALAELVPGTDDHFFFRALHAQNQGRRDEVRRILDDWIRARKGAEPPAARELRHRQALLDYEHDPKSSLDYLRRELNLRFDHSRRAPERRADLPTRLDPALVTGSRFLDAALKGRGDLSAVSDAGLHAVARLPLNPQQRRDLLRRLRRPDLPNLAALIAEDLAAPDSPPFGQMAIHQQLTLEQLDELLRLRPQLRNEAAFVSVYLSRLVPTSETDIEIDAAEREAYLERAWQYVKGLDPVHNSLKANVLYHRLVHDLAVGKPSRERFLEYLKLPRDVPYLPQPLRDSLPRPQHLARLDASFSELLLPPIGVEEPVVRQYLLWLLRDAPNFDEFRPWIRDEFLRRIFAEAKIVNGIGDPQQWAAMISPEEYRAIKERVDLDFAPDNPPVFLPDQIVRLKLFIKNVPTLIVKIYEINTLNYYRDTGRPLNLAINLDGLAPSFPEKKFEFREAKELRVERTFEFPELKGRGVWVIDFIGEGRSSRAFVQKGRLEVVQDISAAGHVFRVLDEAGRPVPDARAWIGGREFGPDAEGRIIVPFAPEGERDETMVVHAGGFASLSRFRHLPETYQLDARPLIVAESLRGDAPAVIALRPLLTLHGQPVNPASVQLEESAVTVTVTDTRGITRRHTFRSPELALDRELKLEVPLPRHPASIEISCFCKIRRQTPGEPLELVSRREFRIAPLLNTLATRQVLLTLTPDGYVAEARGLDGEPLAGVTLHCELHHPWTREPVRVSLRTDDQGRAALGPLSDIERVSVSLELAPPPDLDPRAETAWREFRDQQPHTFHWNPPRDRCWWPSALHGTAGRPLRLPLERLEAADPLAEFSLLEVRRDRFIRDRSAALAIADGSLVLRDLEPGDYSLFIRSRQIEIPVRITRGEPFGRFLLSPRRAIETPPLEPIQLVREPDEADHLVLRVLPAGRHVRVHLAAGRYLVADLFDSPAGAEWPELRAWSRTETRTFYESGRQLGDEFRYVLDRRGALKFLGNMAERPSLLLNPWALRETSVEAERLEQGGQFLGRQAALAGAGPGMGRRAVAATRGAADAAAPEPPDLSPWSLDFLARPATVLLNLKPDAEGRIRIPRRDLAGCCFLRALVVDPCHAVQRVWPLGDPPGERASRALPRSLDPAVPHAEYAAIVPLSPGERHQITAGAVVTAVDSLSKLFAFYSAVAPEAPLAEFEFLTRWSTLSPQQKAELYSRYACHELHLFLYHKDRPFFDTVVAPYLSNKRDPTFLDEWLLGRDLTRWLEPARYARLNAAEKALLARRLPDQRASIARDLADLAAQTPRDREEFHRRFLFLAGELPPSPPAEKLAFAGEAQQAAQLEAAKAVAAAAAPPAPSAAELRARAVPTADRKEREIELLRRDELQDRGEPRRLAAKGDKPQAEADRFLFDNAAAEGRAVAPFYRRPDMPRELAEQGYYRRPLAEQAPTLVPAGRFWAELAAHPDGRPFLSTDFLFTTTNLTEMLLALSTLDLPFESSPLIREAQGERILLRSEQPIFLLVRHVRPAAPAAGPSPVLVAQNFFRADNPWRYEGEERIENYITGPFLVGIPYGAKVVLTNPGAQRRFVSVLLQVPAGAVPLTPLPVEPVSRVLNPYETTTIEYFFYFPAPGEFTHYPATVSTETAVLARAEPFRFRVVAEPPPADVASWPEISQNGSTEQLLAFLERENLYRVRLADIAWRLRDADTYRRIIEALERRRIYDATLWSYSILHNDRARIAQFLARHPFADQCGLWFESPLLTVHPVERGRYQHLEYAPLINARAHPVGREPRIQNPAFRAQYTLFLRTLCYKPHLNDEDRLAATYYLALQDRIAESLGLLAQTDRANVAERLQYDYLTAWLALCRGRPDDAQRALAPYADYPVPRWRSRVQTLLAHIREAEGGPAAAATDPQNRDLVQQQVAAEQPSLDLRLHGRVLEVVGRHLQTVTLNFYPMDLELLFSRNPFMTQDTRHFAHVRPAHSLTISVPQDGTPARVEVPEAMRSLDLMIEAVSGTLRQTQPYYANALRLHLIEPYGQLLLTRADSTAPVPGAYVKVYARLPDGSVKFYKDGYTDLRGRFDYASSQDPSLAAVVRFSLLIVSESHGSLVREAAPPSPPASPQ
ncbi:MAG: hypothetical protein N2652_12260 [Kiritimatiellae bacterium]|nr:hypothetical protein [Kiritimatiellia bacterium]